MSIAPTKSSSLNHEALAERFRRKYWELTSQTQGNADSDEGQAIKALRRLQFSSVTVPLDGARYAEHAIPLAIEMATAAKAPVVLEPADLLFGATYGPGSLSFEEISSPRRRDRMHDYLKGVAHQLGSNPIHVIPQLRKAPLAAGDLLQLAHENNLVVIGQRPSRVADPFGLGSNLERLLKFGSSPVLSVRGYRWPFARRPLQPTERLLVILDGTSEAEQVLPAAAAIAEAAGARMTLLRVLPGLPYYGMPCLEKESEALAYLEKVAESVRQRQVRVDARVRSSGEALGEVILSYAQRVDADVIALTASLRRTLVGTFRRQPVRYLARKSRIPLLIVSSDTLRVVDPRLCHKREGEAPAEP